MAFVHLSVGLWAFFLSVSRESFIIREISFQWWEAGMSPWVCHLIFFIFNSCRSLLLLSTIHLGIVLMNLVKVNKLWSSRFLPQLQEPLGFHKVCLWSFLKYRMIMVYMLKTCVCCLYQTILQSSTQWWNIKTWRYVEIYTRWKATNLKNRIHL